MSKRFVKFKDIEPEKSDSWSGKFILTIDMDWACDHVLLDTIELVRNSKVNACIFITNQTPVLDILKNDDQFELGLHPNFNNLASENPVLDVKQILKKLKRVVPDAYVLRSHSMTTSGRWLDSYRNEGIKYVSNYLMFNDENIHPFYQINGLVEAPVYYADDGELYLNSIDQNFFSLSNANLNRETFSGLKVFNFHPIHIFLNTENLDRYERTRKLHNNPEELIKHRYAGFGARDRLLELLKTT